MNKFIVIIICSCLFPMYINAQLGVNTKDAQTSVHVKANISSVGFIFDGIIPPIITGNQLNAKVYTNLQEGCIVFVSSGRTSGNNSQCNEVKRPGVYFFDGTIWKLVRNGIPYVGLSLIGNNLTSTVYDKSSTTTVINQLGNSFSNYQLKTTVNKVNSNSIVVPNLYTISDGELISNIQINLDGKQLNFSNYDNNSKFIIGNNLLNIQKSSNNIGINTSLANAYTKIDVRSSGSNPTGIMAVGTTAITAQQAKAGALRYNTTSGGVLEYSDGENWKTIQSSVQKSLVIATNVSNRSFSSGDKTVVNNWTEVTDINSDFNPSEGIFIAPRKGNYFITFRYTFSKGSFKGNSSAEAWISITKTSGSTKKVRYLKSLTGYNSNGNNFTSADFSFVVHLEDGEEVRPIVYHTLGYGKKFISDASYNYFSVGEL